MKTIFALVVYCLAIGLLVASTVVIVVKLIFWPPCTQSGKICVIDSWSVAGLAGTILAVAATVLAILGAVAVAAWWVSLNARVTDQVNSLYNANKEEIKTEILKSRVTNHELQHLRNFERAEFFAQNSASFIPELSHLLLLDLIARQHDRGIRSLEASFKQNKQVNVKDHFYITEAGRDYLRRIGAEEINQN